MPSQEELAKVVQEMRAQGLSEKEIAETLADMGVPEDLIRSLLSPATSSPPAKEVGRAEPEDLLFTPSEQTVQKKTEETTTPAASSDNLFGSDVLSSLMTAEPPREEKTAPPPPPPPAEEKPAPFEANVTQPPILEEESVPSEKLDEIHSKVDELRRTLSSTPIRDDLAEIKEMLRELKKDLSEVRSMFSAIQKILQEILDTDRSILVDLYEKTKK